MGNQFRCIRPSEHRNVNLYVQRSEENKLKSIIEEYLNCRGTQRCLLVTGERGIGKSIIVRFVLSALKFRDDFFPIIIDGDRIVLVDDLIEKIAENFLIQIRHYFPEEKELLLEASHLWTLITCDSFNRSDLQSLEDEIAVEVGGSFGIISFIQNRLGVSSSNKSRTETNDSFCIKLDDQKRIRLLSEMFKNVSKRLQREPLLFIDNLDQITEDEKIEKLLKNLLWLDGIPLIITIRKEFKNMNVLKEFSDLLDIGPLKPSEIVNILHRRIEKCKINDPYNENFWQISEFLANCTDNPWAFLKWISFITKNADINENLNKIVNDFKQEYMRSHYEIELEAFRGTNNRPLIYDIVKWFTENEISGNKYMSSRSIMKEFGLDSEDVSILEDKEIIIPLDKTLPSDKQLYKVSPSLHFLRL